jgi:hypothetical protein
MVYDPGFPHIPNFVSNSPVLAPVLCSLTEYGVKFFCTLTILGIDFSMAVLIQSVHPNEGSTNMANMMSKFYMTSAAACGAACAAFMYAFLLSVLGIATAMSILFAVGALRLCLCTVLVGIIAVVREILILCPQSQKARFG